MSHNHVAMLPDRGVVEVKGTDARRFLHGLLTSAIDTLEPGSAVFCGLLTPQGKIICDFFVVAKTDNDFLLDCPRDQTAEIVRRLALYKLRSSVDIRDVSSNYTVSVAWSRDDGIAGGDAEARTVSSPGGLAYEDPRLPALGLRLLLTMSDDWVPGELDAKPTSATAYHAHRLAHGVPEGGRDYVFGDTFPHEALYDQLHGVDFEKGCYVGQEVVSRMQHRGTARKRVVQVKGNAPLPEGGGEVKAGGATIGRLGSVNGAEGLALLRIDRVAEARERGQSVETDGIPLDIAVPAWATFVIAPRADGSPEDPPAANTGS